jgi:hypothetical protein
MNNQKRNAKNSNPNAPTTAADQQFKGGSTQKSITLQPGATEQNSVLDDLEPNKDVTGGRAQCVNNLKQIGLA